MSPDCLLTEAGSVSGVQVDDNPSRGTRGDVRVVANDNVHCQHVNSVFAWNGNGGFEFGYVVGYSNCAGYRNTFYSAPRPFWWAYNSQGGYVGCGVFTGRSLAQAQFDTFRASDTNGNGEWGSWINGIELQPGGILLDFSTAANGFGMERGNGGDEGYSRFEDLSEYHVSNGWTHWDDLRLNGPTGDSDPDYNLNEINNFTATIDD